LDLMILEVFCKLNDSMVLSLKSLNLKEGTREIKMRFEDI